MEALLNIRITPNPTRRTFWRVVRVAGILLGAWTIAHATIRLGTQFDTRVLPEHATAIRIVRSPQVIEDLQHIAGGGTVIPGLPLSLSVLTAQAKRTVHIWSMPDGNVIVLLDRRISDDEERSWSTFGIAISREKSSTVLALHETSLPNERSLPQGILRGLSLHTHGSLHSEGTAMKITVAPTSLTVNAPLLDAPLLNSSPDAHTLFAATLRAEEIALFFSQSVTENTPGLASFIALASRQGISAVITQETNVPRVTFAIPLTQDTQIFTTKETLTALAREIVELPTINGIPTFLSDGTRTQSLRVREEATIILRDESPYRFITATTADHTASITQTPTLLTVKNFTNNTTGPVAPPLCIANAHALVQPRALRTFISTPTAYQPSTFTSLAWNAASIASNASITRICFQ